MKPPEIISRIRKAASKTHTLLLNYKDADGVKSSREIEPYSFRGSLFFAYDVKKKNIRSFKISRIVTVKETSRQFRPRWPVEIGAKKRSPKIRPSSRR